MTGRRHSPSLSSPPSSKLPKFLQKASTRDRSKSVTDSPSSSTPSSPATSASNDHASAAGVAPSSSSSVSTTSSRRRSLFLSSKSASKPDPSNASTMSGNTSISGLSHTDTPRNGRAAGAGGPGTGWDDDEDPDLSRTDEAPIIIEPSGGVRPRDPSTLLYTSPTSRMADLPNRLSGWFTHAFTGSTGDLNLPTVLATAAGTAGVIQPSSSPKRSNPLLTAAKQGKGHLDKAMRYLLDSDATPDKSPEPIWLLGVRHTGYEPGRSSLEVSRGGGSGGGGGAPSTASAASASAESLVLSFSQLGAKHPWPQAFYSDFTTRVWCTYRSHFAPIRDSALSALESELGREPAMSASPPARRWWGGEKGWTSDSGWGCMLRTGQSVLANALIHYHLGREWRVPPMPEHTADFAQYVRIITWFLDTPSPLAPFSVHRMALAGKELGKDVGQWFGPSTAAGAIRTLVGMFPGAGLGVAVAVDGVVYQTDVYSASHGPIGSPRRHRTTNWGDRGVLVLIGVRLGLDGVNPIYYDTIKTLYTFPQSVGIAGGRPSSSYYFVGSQADNLFYLDPHHSRPAVPLRPPPTGSETSSMVSGFDARPAAVSMERASSSASQDEPHPRRRTAAAHQPHGHGRTPVSPSSSRPRSPLSPSSSRSSRSAYSVRAPVAATPLQQTLSGGSDASSAASHTGIRAPGSTGGWSTGGSTDALDIRELTRVEELDPVQEHFASAYTPQELRTFHCERVRKMPLSGLDPSMLIGFLCRDEADWKDLRARLADLAKTHKAIFSVQDEPPNWPSDNDSYMGFESFSDPDAEEMDEEEGGEGSSARSEGYGSGDEFFDASAGRSHPSRSPSRSPHDDSDDDDSSVPDPVTPGAGRSPYALSSVDKPHAPEPDDIEDDWVDPSVPTPATSPEPSPQPENAPLPLDGSRVAVSPSASSFVPVQMSESATTVKNAAAPAGSSAEKRRKGSRGSVRASKHAQEPSYPFPVSASQDSALDEPDLHEAERSTDSPEHGGPARRMPQMRTAVARDGGRTKSGGVRGIPADPS